MEEIPESLQTAIKDDNLSQFISHLIDFNDLNKYYGEITLLHAACMMNAVSLVSYLISNGANPFCKTKDFLETTLHLACHNNSLETIRILCKCDGFDIDEGMRHKSTALRIACLYGHTNVVQLLIELGANIELAERTGRTPLISAVEKGHLDIVKILLKNKCDIDTKDRFGRSALFYAIRYRQKLILKVLISCNVSINTLDNRGLSPLHVATRLGFYDIVQILIQANCDIDIKGSIIDGGPKTTALWQAVENGFTPVVTTLLNGGADPNIGDENLGSALFALLMAETCDLEILQVLLEAGVKLDYYNKDGYSALHFAVDKAWIELAEIILTIKFEFLRTELTWINAYVSDNNTSENVKNFLNHCLYLGNQVESLKNYCRYVIRDHLSYKRPINANIALLSIPPFIMKFLQYNSSVILTG